MASRLVSRIVRGVFLLVLALPLACTSSVREASTRLRSVPERTAIEHRDKVAVEAALGHPDRVRVERPAEVWQYMTKRCVLDVTFYPGPDQRLRAEYLESRGADGVAMAITDCLMSFAGEAKDL
ncbi:hypothetical protein HEQ58_10370 [Haematospirillum jordaniae]|uniref:hypothetical protein n=1 Tax=Haematospirillum jordaniae TaxID=1549855 RepID=UPI00143304CD|nr:hypothetical protein [Haematospirillum jordaniae]NKD58113.1 hypothetical protein [Haematospirillum jordaniae]NKD80175.1 hypothetical protein [Haematospirillum jordaniae]NKD86633.1 hypothetical protein [Haematospirillum jordaniae]